MTASLAPNIETNNKSIINPIQNKAFDMVGTNLSDFKTTDASGTNFSKILTDAASAKTQQAHTKFVDKAAKSNTSSINKKALDNTPINSQDKTQATDESLKNTDEVKNIKNKQEERTQNCTSQNCEKTSQNKIDDNESQDRANETNTNVENAVNDINISNDSDTNKKDNHKKPQSNSKNETNEVLNDTKNSSFVAPSPVFSSDETEDKTQNDTTALLKDKISDLSNNAVGEAPQKQNNTQKDDLITNMIDEINSLIENITNNQNSSNLSQDNKKGFLEALENLKSSLENVSNDDETQVDFENLVNMIQENLNNIPNLHNLSGKENETSIKNDFEKLKDVLSATESTVNNLSLNDEIKNLINETKDALENQDSDSVDEICQNINKILDEAIKFKSENEDLVSEIKELKSSLENIQKSTNNELNKKIENLNEIAKSINNQDTNISVNLNQDLSTGLQETKEFIDNIDINDLKEFINNNNIDKKDLDKIVNLINSYDESQNNISFVNELSLKLNQILKNNDIKDSAQNSEIVQKLTDLNDVLKEFLNKETKGQVSNSLETSDIKNIKINLNSTDANNFNDSKNNGKNLNSEQAKNDIVEKMDIEVDGFSTLNESGALSVADEVAKIALSETGITTPSVVVGNIVYDSACGNGVLINNVHNLKNIQSANFQIPNTMEQQLDSSDVLNQIGNKLSDLAQENGKKLTMVLRPNDLGRLSIELSTNKDGLTTNIIAQNEDVRNYIEKNINNLRQQLQDAGVNINNIQIKTAGQEGSTKYDGTFNQHQQNNNQNNQQNNNQHQQNNKQDEYKKIVSNLNYDFNFAKDFSNVLSKTLSYSLNK